MPRQHTDKDYEAELAQLRHHVLMMGAKIEDMISNSMKAFINHDLALAERMIQFDHQINCLEIETDEMCLRILARRQPVASDLRLITITLKLVTDLERIGDLVKNICERVVEMGSQIYAHLMPDFEKMFTLVQQMIHEALDAFVACDVERSKLILERDHEVDAIFSKIFSALLLDMQNQSSLICQASRLQSIAKYLERIGDHTTNVAEMVVFMAKGQDIRHQTSRHKNEE